MKIPEPFTDPNDEAFDNSIAVVGMAGRFAGATDITAFWENLRNNVESIVTLSEEALLSAGVSPALMRNPNYVKAAAPLPEMDMFDAGFFGLSPREAAIMDPQHRQFLECAWQALEDAAHPPERFAGSIGVFAGSGFNAYLPFNLLTNAPLVESAGMFLLRHTGNDKDFLTTRLSYLFNLTGPSINVQTACSTSLVAIHMAAQSLLNRECDMALAGGSTIELPHGQGYLHEDGGILSPDGHCRPFDVQARGTVFGSGAGAIVLRRLGDAIADGDHIYAVIRGSAVNNDGAGKVGYLAPSVDGHASAVAEALAIADVTADTITYVEAHGTGTPVGDPIELAALTQAFRQTTDEVGFCAIGSVKGNIGHTDTAAGVAGFIKVALAIKHGELPPTLHYTAANPACEFDHSPFFVNATLRPWATPVGMPRRAGISSLGVGGTNAHVVLEQPPLRQSIKSVRPHQLLTLSARSATALDANSASLAAYLAANPALDIGDIAYTLQVGRQEMPFRRSVVVDSAATAARMLGTASPEVTTGAETIGTREVVFMFAGGGSQYPNMGLDLYLSESVFREAVDECLELLYLNDGIVIRDWLFPAAGKEAAAAPMLQRPSIGLPALFIIQYAQARLWMSWGVVPKAMIGHSLGEYMAAHLAGVFGLGDVLALVALRGRLFETVAGGRMLSVTLDEASLRALLPAGLSIAAVNGPDLTVASGPSALIEALEARLTAAEIACATIPISIAAHSEMLTPILGEFGAFFRRVTMHSPKKPYISNVTGTWVTPAQSVDANYWVAQMRGTVRFAEGLQTLFKDGNCVLLEVGPGRTLSSLARHHPARQPQQAVFNSLRHPDENSSDLAFVLGVLGRLWATGVPVNWGCFWQNEKRLRVPLPPYRFDRHRHWIEPGKALAATGGAGWNGDLARKADIGDWFYQPVWQRADRPEIVSTAVTALIFDDDLGMSTALADRLMAHGRDVVRVRAGRRFARVTKHVFTINPGAPADYEAMISRLSDEGRAVREIYHLWTVTGAPRKQPGIDAAEAMQRRGFFSLLYLAQALGREDGSATIALAVISDHLQRISTETGLIPAKSTLLGACKVIPREFLNVRTRSIDIEIPPPASLDASALADDIIGETGGYGDESDAVAYRAGERWVQNWAPVQLKPAPGPEPGARGLRAGGVYLITGGLGGIGLTLARHLAATVEARLVLVVRNALPPRGDWPARLDSFDPDDGIAERIRQVLAIEQLGSEVLVVGADVTNLAQMRHAVQYARSHFGQIDGVFHTAGVLDDGVALLKDSYAAAAVLAPKVRGTLVLEAALGEIRPDFLMLFSSISATIGLAGQIDYAAANAFLDSYAQSRNTANGTYVVAVDWSQWQDVGMAAALAQELGLTQGRSAPSRAAGHPLLGRCLRDTPGERVYEVRLSPATHWLLDEHRVADDIAVIPGTGYLEIIRAALAEHPEARPVEITDLVFLEAFVVGGGSERDLRIRLLRRGDGWRFSVEGRAVASEPDALAEWVEHVRGGIAYVDALRPGAVETASILARCRIGYHIGNLPSAHINFGPRWQNVVRVDYGAAEALVSLELPAAFAAEIQTFALHPALLDFATAGAQALMPGFDDTRDFFVPASYGRLRIHAPLEPRLLSHVRYRSDGPADTGLATYDVTIMSETGEVLAEVSDFTMLRLVDHAVFGDGQLTRRPSASPARATLARPIVNLGFAEDYDNSIVPAEGMAVIDRILANRRGAQILVSPQAFAPLAERLRRPIAPTVVTGTARATGPRGGVPVSSAERMVAALWSEMLGVVDIGLADDFFDLGGHSLLAVQLINKLRRKTGKTLPLTVLLEAATVAALAALIDGGTEARDADLGSVADDVNAAGRSGPGLVRIRAGGNKVPVYFVHDGLGETLLYRTLAMKLDPGHPVYGLQPQTRPDGGFVHTEIADMAVGHVAKVRETQPHGPYLFAGLCAGGVIAFEMARQLQDAGETVSFVGLIDAADTAAARRPFIATRARIGRLVEALGGAADERLPRRLAMVVPRLVAKAGGFMSYEIGVRLDNRRTARAINSSHRDAEAEAEADNAETVGREATMEAPSFLKMYQLAHRRHRPRGLFTGGDVALFKATASNGAADDTPYREHYRDRILGWGKRVADDVSVIDIPGGHSSALQAPHVSTLARALQECITAAMLKVPSVEAPPRPRPKAPSVVQPVPRRRELEVAAE